MGLIKRLVNEEDGQDVIEYVIITAMISIVAIILVNVTGLSVESVWSGVNNDI